jgi:hypothetical protein
MGLMSQDRTEGYVIKGKWKKKKSTFESSSKVVFINMTGLE